MSVFNAVDVQPHEFDVHYHFTDFGLKPYYALDHVRKSHDWDGKPTAEITFEGVRWALCFDYDSQPLQPWSDDSYRLHSTPLFRLYFVAKDDTYDGERADHSQRVKGGTMTVRPRWPNMKKETGEKVRGYMDISEPYLDVQVQASNFDPHQYLQLVREAMAAFDVNPRYFANPADTSNINDCAVYVRVRRDESGPLHAPDGPLARTHNVLMSDRDGYRKHVEDNRKLPGYYVTTTITDQQASDVIRGHRYGKEVKHYHPENPNAFTKDEYGYHPKLEVSFQTSLTDETVSWDDLGDLIRELDETLLCYLEWSGLSSRAGDHFVSDAYFSHTSETKRSRKLPDCPLPTIEDGQEQTVINLWRNMTEADEALVEELMSDGATVSPAEAADKTGYTYRTIRKCINRLEGFIRHTYGQIEIASKAMRDKMLRRIHAAEQELTDAIGNTTMQIADLANERDRGPWSRWKRNYNVTVRKADDCRNLLKIRYNPDDRQELRAMLQSGVNAYREVFGETIAGIHAKVEFADGSHERIRDILAHLDVRKSATAVAEEARRWQNAETDSVDWDAWAEQERQRATR